MGLTVENQVDTKQYFCLSKIDPEQMKDPKRQTMTKIYKYEDFRGVKYVQS